MFPKFFDNRLILYSLRPAVAHEAQVEQVHVSFILRVVYSYRITNNFVSKRISEILHSIKYSY